MSAGALEPNALWPNPATQTAVVHDSNPYLESVTPPPAGVDARRHVSGIQGPKPGKRPSRRPSSSGLDRSVPPREISRTSRDALRCLEGELTRLETQNDSLRGQLAAVETEIAQLRAAQRALEERLDAVLSGQQRTERERDEALEEVELLRHELRDSRRPSNSRKTQPPSLSPEAMRELELVDLDGEFESGPRTERQEPSFGRSAQLPNFTPAPDTTLDDLLAPLSSDRSSPRGGTLPMGLPPSSQARSSEPVSSNPVSSTPVSSHTRRVSTVPPPPSPLPSSGERSTTYAATPEPLLKPKPSGRYKADVPQAEHLGAVRPSRTRRK